MLRKQIFGLLIGFSFGCGALNTARPLDKGKHAVGLTFGGLFITQLGPPMPLPNLVVEGKTGLDPVGDHPLEVNYGINTTALAFGIVGFHGGVTTLLSEQKGWVPSVSVMERLHFYNNYLDTTKPSETRGAFALNQVDVTLGWDIKRHVGYVGMANYLDLMDPELNMTPFAGFAYQTKKRFFWQLETRYMAMNRKQDIDDVAIYGGERGGFAATVSAGWKLGGAK